MKKLATAAVLVAVVALVASALASAGRTKEIGVRATLNAAQEVPAQAVKNAAGRGAFTATLIGRTLTWKLTFSHLTGPAAAAHIHLGGMGKPGNVAVPLCAPCRSGAHGKAKLNAATLKALEHHLTYVNVHTAKNPAGEIRGQISTHA